MNTPAPKTSPDAALGNLMAAALDVPAAPEQPAVPDDTLTRTGNTADHQAGWFAGMEQGQANAQGNAAIRAGAAPGVSTVAQQVKTDDQNVGQIVDDYIQAYELRGEDEEGRDGVYSPNETERYMIADAIYGLLAEPEFIAAIAGMHNAPAAGDARELKRKADLIAELSKIIHNMTVAQQAAWIEWQHGAGAEAGMQWIENGLAGPGQIPDAGEPYGTEAQAYFDANQADPLPVCYCGRPSNILHMGNGYCSTEHHKAALAARQGKGGAA